MTVFALAFVSACGASGGDDATSSTTQASESSTTTDEVTTTTEDLVTTTTEKGTDAVDVKKWAQGFCGSFENWLGDVKQAGSSVGDSIQPGDVPGAKAAIVNMFATVSDDTRSLIDSLEGGGFPDIDNGDDFTDELIGKFQEFDDAIVTAKGEAEGLPLDNPTAFKTEVDALVATFTSETESVGASFGQLDTKYQSAELNAALTESCNL
ncbi:MAG: hypothetical protein ABIP03_08500 [Aquihabitans sp.]